ncbi:glycosyltransferase [Nocardioides zhouii]|uniref:Glycosyltransferase n=1 Tax=Nocardioides zhouii TaxID=1168729 RepID=A0A4Q2SJN9_9ACTN|nr:glycosyltransferase [Nocardioides zhouii]RYC05806.1 glycosyltransferase [Nocardioides zhouii]
MRLLVFIPNLADGGAQRQCVRLVNELATREGLDVVLVRHPGGVHESQLDLAGIVDRPLPAGRSHRDPRAVVDLRRIIRETRPDVVMTWLTMGDIVGRLALAGLGLPWVIAERDSAHPPGWRSTIRRPLGRRADLILAISREGADYWRTAGRPASRPTVVVDNIVVAPPPRAPAARDTIAFIGRLAHQKNVHVVARAMALSAAAHPDLRHVIVGQGALESEVRAIVRDHAVDLAGYVEDVHAVLERSLAVILVSHHEGLPNVVLEAVTHGVPVVASDLPEHRALLGPDYPYFVADRDSPEAVAQVVRRVVAAPAPGALDHARARVAAMTPAAVADSYLTALAPHTR